MCHVIFFNRAHRIENSTKYRADGLCINFVCEYFCFVAPTFFCRQITSFSDSFHYTEKPKILYVGSFNYISYVLFKWGRIGAWIQPCMRLARGKFELTNQHSAGGKSAIVLTSSKQVRKGTEIKPLFSLEMALNTHKKGLAISKTISDCKK